MNFVIWGAGRRGKVALDFLEKDNVVAFIDSNENLQSSYYLGKIVIDFITYENKYRESFLVVSPKESEEIEKFLKEKNIYDYLLLSDFL